MRHIVHATSTLVKKILRDYAEFISDDSELAIRLAYLYVSLDELIVKSQIGLELLHHLVTKDRENVTHAEVLHFNDHVSEVCATFSKCYSSFKALRSILWDAYPFLFQELMVALNAKAFGTLKEIYHQSPGFGVDDRSKYEIDILRAMLCINYDEISDDYFIGKAIEENVKKVREYLRKERYFPEGFPMSLDIHKKMERDLSFEDSDLILKVTDIILPAKLGSKKALAFYDERKDVVQSLIKVKELLRDHLRLSDRFTDEVDVEQKIDSDKIYQMVYNTLSHSISVYIRCDINLYIYSHITVEICGAIFSEDSIYHSVRSLFGRDIDFEKNLKKWFPENLSYKNAVKLGRMLFEGISLRPG
jgi:hypothetical protein